MADLSSNNGTVDIANYSLANHAVIAIKATEGKHYDNPFHLKQCQEAHSRGLTVVHYHFCRPGQNDLEAEIANFRNVYLKGWHKGDYICFDLETNEVSGTSNYAEAILRRFYAMTKHPPILYSYSSFITEHLTGVRFPGNRWWIANYSNKSPNRPNGSSVLWAWQYTDGKDGPEPHHFAGIGQCDGSIVNYQVAIRLWARKLRKRKGK